MKYPEDALLCQVLLREKLIDIEALTACAEMQKNDAGEGQKPRTVRELLVDMELFSDESLTDLLRSSKKESSRTRRRRRTKSYPDLNESSRVLSPEKCRRPSSRRYRQADEPETIGHFEIIKKLASGGMGAVYLAKDRVSEQTVALKILSPEREKHIDIERFLREARIVCSLQHEGLVQGLNLGNAAGQHFFAMEYVQGESLKARLKNVTKLPPRIALDMTLRVARTLDYLHNNGLVHRDVKPENIILSDRGEVKLCDLGLAREVDMVTSLTQTGQTVGTPLYISPEQALGSKDIDVRCDIYSLGVTFFHMLTGHPPFDNPNGVLVMSQHIRDRVPSILASDRQLPVVLDRVVSKMTRRERHERFQSMSELVHALEQAVRSFRKSPQHKNAA